MSGGTRPDAGPTHPQHSAAVVASAGTGKTWLLVTRLVRLLLDGATPDAILAITFTRKAAAEMQTRLLERLYALAAADDAALSGQLAALDVTPTPAVCDSARHLYEQVLRSVRPVRFFTFHAFCQDILRRFPLEAEVPPGFELIEDTGLLQTEAWDALVAAATAAPDGAAARALAALLEACNGLSNTHQAMTAFLTHRGDWWAYTATAAAPVAWATERLAQQLRITPDEQPEAAFFSAANGAALREFRILLNRHATATNLAYSAALDAALDDTIDAGTRFAGVTRVFLTAGGALLKRKSSQVQQQKMGHDGDCRFLELHEQLGAQILACIDRRNKLHTLAVNGAWYLAGTQFLAHYQRLKLERRQLDFTDLEWKACQLLNESNNAHWVQYKLDQRIDHVLVDEFQDTNPTQWRLLLPLLEELAAGATERRRSVFLVGDNKQSIYRFRRADPRLFDNARAWLTARAGAVEGTLTSSYRSSPAIIDFINRVFGSGRLAGLLPAFTPHTTHRDELSGAVEMLPLIGPDATVAADPPPFRRPLQTPRVTAQDQRYRREGAMIAARIRDLIDNRVMLGAGRNARPAGYDDIIILVRNRTHVQAYEQALRDAGIPYTGQTRGTLMECLEIQDMTHLLRVLVAPYDNLALASTLRSPLFDCSDADLIDLAAAGGNGGTPAPAPWLDRLERVGADRPAPSPLGRARRQIGRWRELANTLPVHDLLDRIYHEANVLERYDAAFPLHLRARARANLTRFIELALEVDSGRYPSLSHFLDRLERLTAHGTALDEAPVTGSGGSVRIMTIHGAKGLEAGVVFVADAAAAGNSGSAYQALIDWPPAEHRPDTFLLTGTQDRLDSFSKALLATHDAADRREEINLLYVALTRARQLLFISANASPRNNADNWYQLLAEGLAPDDVSDNAGGWRHHHGTLTTQPSPAGVDPPPASPAVAVELSRPLPAMADQREIAPSLTAAAGITGHATDDDARLRGTVIHRLLEWQTTHPEYRDATPPDQLRQEFAGCPDLPACWQEASRVVRAPELRAWFDANRHIRAYNEITIQYRLGADLVHGVIDRLVVSDQGVTIIDYKTHRHACAGNLVELAQPYREQLRLYRAGVERLWPGKPVTALVLFTACAAAVAV